MFSKKLLCGLCLALYVSSVSFADVVALNPNAPERYTVVEGDTLWDISARFLRDPWLWPEIWQVNPEIENPHLIYPGDELFLTYDKNGRPIVTVQRGRPTVKLSPHARASRIDQAIPTIPVDAIRQFLTRAGVTSKEEYAQAPYIVAFQNERITAATGDKAYVRNLVSGQHPGYRIARIGDAYQNPGAKRDDILGYELIEVADADLEREGDPATFVISKVNREILQGDRVFPSQDTELLQNFLPRKPDNDINGLIISVLDGVSRIGQFHVVVLNQGENVGLQPGHVLKVWQSGRTVRDTFSGKSGKAAVVTLPDEPAGLVMVFRTFAKVSYALVMQAERDIRLYDKVKTPDQL